MANNARLYPYSLEEAQRQNVVEQWLDSRTDNARCRKSISKRRSSENLMTARSSPAAPKA